MAIIRLTNDNFQTVELLANPERTFSSSSAGITGSVALFADASSGVKDLEPTYGDASGSIDVQNLELFRNQIVELASGNPNAAPPTEPSTDIYAGLSSYMRQVGNKSMPIRSSKRQEILRFIPGVRFDRNFLSKLAVQKTLFPYYRNLYPTTEWSFTNYNCLNFVTGGNFPTDSVIIYPAATGTLGIGTKNPYGPAKAFTFDFYLNARYTTERPGEEYTPGTILHMSSCYALSLVTGSSIGPDGKPDGFRMLLQLSSSANIPPSKCYIAGNTVTTSESDEDAQYAFVSSDNSIKKNHWHHVAVRWGGDPPVNNRTGSFVIDETVRGEFVIDSSSVMQTSGSGLSLPNPNALFVGNFYEGSNYGNNGIAQFFNSRVSKAEGLINLGNHLPVNDPGQYTFAHPLNAEIHDVKIYDRYRRLDDIIETAGTGSKLSTDLLFYVPPFFIKETRNRNILQTPFYTATGSTEEPFNVALSFGVNGLSINLENYMQDFVTNQFPRLLNLSCSQLNTQVQNPRTANFLIYESGSSVKRNLTLLPCDNGKFFPNYDLLTNPARLGISSSMDGTRFPKPDISGTFDDKFVDAFGNKDYTAVSLLDMVPTSSMLGNIPSRTQIPDTGTGPQNPPRFENEGSLLQSIEGPTPEDPGIEPGTILTVLQRTQDPSSNEVVFFDISNMFYGDRIQPGTVVVQDLNVSGSHGRMAFKLKDDKRGNLYRADALTDHPTWASVGNVLYEEGIIVIKTPHMPLFGEDSFKITFAGERYVYVLEIMVPLVTSLFNSSSNPTYQELAPSDYVNETADRFTYITGINLHDDNINVIGRTHLAQPIIKREGDKYMIKIRIDY